MKTIDMKTLQEMEACQDARDWFADTYGDGPVTLTAEALQQVPSAEWVGWLADTLSLEARTRARAAYRASRSAAWNIYLAVRESMQRIYDTTEPATWSTYGEIEEMAYDDYSAASNWAWAVYRSALIDIILTTEWRG